MRRAGLAALLVVLAARPLGAQEPQLLPDSVIATLGGELSGQIARRNLDVIAGEHRSRGSRGFHHAAEHIVARLLEYGLSDARIESFSTDKQFYGTQRARRPWDADFAELWELRQGASGWERSQRLASWEEMPVSLAEDSESGKVVAALVDVGDGTAESDYAGKDVRGKLVLAGQQADAVAQLAVERFGAVGIVSYAQNQRTAWWGEDENLVRWGHLDSFSARPTFAFMISLKQARALRLRLARGEEIRLDATVRAGQHAGPYEVVTATIPGADPALRSEEIAFSCHLDHQRPGANDNASGCVTILEVARTLSKLIAAGRLPRPARTLRFVWPPEVEGTLALLNGRPELAGRIKAVIHMDMVGGGPETKATFHVTRGPGSLPSFVYDVGAAFGALVNRESAAYAETGQARMPLVSPEGGREAFKAEFPDFTMGSDHDVYAEGSYRIPPIYLNDWPDRYIHTNRDVPANIDPTKLRRAAFIGAASGYYLASLTAGGQAALLPVLMRAATERVATLSRRRSLLDETEGLLLQTERSEAERAVFASVAEFVPLGESDRNAVTEFLGQLDRIAGSSHPSNGLVGLANGRGRPVYRRVPDPKGPMSVFGYDYLEDHLGKEKAAALRLPQFRGLRGSGGEYAYEVLNLVDGTRNDLQIRNAVSAFYGPIPLELVSEYLEALAAIGVIRR